MSKSSAVRKAVQQIAAVAAVTAAAADTTPLPELGAMFAPEAGTPEATSATATASNARPKHQPTQVQAEMLKTLATTSDRIRYLSSEKLTTSQIKDVLGIRYQHVRNVLVTPVKNPGMRGRVATPVAV